jgi:hypothetical protein
MCRVFPKGEGATVFFVEVAEKSRICLIYLASPMKKVARGEKSPYPRLGGLGKIA